jgi:hypothetical protein
MRKTFYSCRRKETQGVMMQEIKSIDVISWAKIHALFGIVFGLFYGIMFAILGVLLSDSREACRALEHSAFFQSSYSR